jgi:hypothetical protein
LLMEASPPRSTGLYTRHLTSCFKDSSTKAMPCRLSLSFRGSTAFHRRSLVVSCSHDGIEYARYLSPGHYIIPKWAQMS